MTYQIFYPQHKDRKYESFRYPAGEVQVRIMEDQFAAISAAEHWQVIARISDGEIMEVAQLVDALHHVDNARVDLVLPYLPYSRADRRFVPGDCNGLAVLGRMLSSVPYDRLFTIDAHNEQNAGVYLRNLINVSPLPIIESVMADLGEDLQILLPDEGASRYRLGNHHYLQCSKERNPSNGRLTGFKVPKIELFRSKNVLIVDDICDGGGTFLGIADALGGLNLKLHLYVTHGIFSKGLTELNKRFEKIYTTNSVNPAAWPGLEILPCTGVIFDAMLSKAALWENASAID